MRQSIQPTYDSNVTGPRFHVTCRVNGKTVAFQEPIADPFVRQTTTVTWPGLLRALLRFRPLVVEVIVGGDRDVVEDVLGGLGGTNGETLGNQYGQVRRPPKAAGR